ncbi:hypothetical protein Tco_1438457 [Tanacetum coccineum]
MRHANPIHTLGDYSKPIHEGYRNTIELPVGNNVVNGCLFYGFWSEDPNQHLKDFLKFVESLDLDGENRERTRMRSYYSFPCSILSTGKDRKTSQRYPGVSTTSRRISIRSMDSFQGLTPKSHSSWHRPLAPKDLTLYDNKSWNDPRDFAKPIKAISLPQDVPSTSDRRLIELENQVQRLMEAHLAPTQPTQVNKITTLCEIYSGPHDTQYCIEDPEQTFVEYASSRTDKAREGLVFNFLASQDARLSKFEADFKQQQSEMTNKIDTVLKAITDRIAGALPNDTVKNPKLSTSSVLSARSYLTEDPQCSTHIHGSINTITIHPKHQNDSRDSTAKEKEDAPLLKQKDLTAVDNLGPNKDDEEIEWVDAEEPLDLVKTSEESFYESLIKEMPKCLLNYDFKIKKGDPRNLKIPCMIGHKFMANAYIDADLPMNIMSLAYYNSIRKNGYEYRGRNFIGLGRDMHVFVGNMSYVIDLTILENIETNIDPSFSHITFKTPYKDPERTELSSKGHDLLSSRVILSEDDYDRGCRKPSDLEEGFYRDTIKLRPEYVTGMDDEGEVIIDEKKLGSRKAHLLEDKQILSVEILDEVFSTWMAFGGNTLAGDGITGIKRRRRDQSSDGVRIMATASGHGRLKEDLESSTW